MKYDVFISYSSRNQKVVEAICAYLEQHKVRCFVAYRDIPKGVVWAKAIVEALDESKMMVVVFSEEFNMSDQVDREIELASEDKKPILTFRISDTMFKGAKKYYLKNINWIDAFPNPENLFDSLLNNVNKLIGTSTLEKEVRKTEQKHIEQERLERERKEAATREKADQKCIEQNRIEREKLETVKKKDKDVLGSHNGHEYVDLGLPSGLKWATCNVGANKPEEYGDYFAWGEHTPKLEYSEGTYEHITRGFLGINKSYVSLGDISGKPQYDAARFNWGGSWRLPTKKELDELEENCTWTWTTQGGNKGYKVTGPNGNSIFLPSAGHRYGSSLYDGGYYGSYWSSTPFDDNYVSAYYLDFDNGNEDVYWGYYRYIGLSVRPITE
ncbi:MAG: TIR domain-containing protein [Bacteroidales bacterium]|nr:TIR domain-containing protein [Bacteroidales bacterium]